MDTFNFDDEAADSCEHFVWGELQTHGAAIWREGDAGASWTRGQWPLVAISAGEEGDVGARVRVVDGRPLARHEVTHTHP